MKKGQQSLDSAKLLEALKARSEFCGTGWEMLFDSSGYLIDGAIDETTNEPDHLHPLAEFYEDYAKRFWGLGHSVFTPYDACVPVVSANGVAEAFREVGQEKRLPTFKVAGAREKYRLDPRAQTVGILTAGGNAPGLNMVIDSIVKRHSLLATMAGAEQNADGSIQGMRFWGYLGGYVGLISKSRIELNVRVTDKVSLAPGSVLKIQRGETPPEQIANAVKRDKLDILYVIGGNGTITAANLLCERLGDVRGSHGQLVRVVAAPKTMDNDVNFSDVTFGFRTSVENAVAIIQRIHAEAEACERIGVIELFGAASGFVALHASYASGEVDYVLIPEALIGSEEEKSAEFDRAVDRLATRFQKRRHAILVVAEGATAALTKDVGSFTHGAHAAKQAGFDSMVKLLTERLNKRFEPAKPPPVFTSQPKHLIRSSAPNSEDIDLCKQTGKLMVDAALAGMSRCVICLWGGRFVLVPMGAATTSLRRVDVGGYYFLSMMEKYLLKDRYDDWQLDPSMIGILG